MSLRAFSNELSTAPQHSSNPEQTVADPGCSALLPTTPPRRLGLRLQTCESNQERSRLATLLLTQGANLQFTAPSLSHRQRVHAQRLQCFCVLDPIPCFTGSGVFGQPSPEISSLHFCTNCQNRCDWRVGERASKRRQCRCSRPALAIVLFFGASSRDADLS